MIPEEVKTIQDNIINSCYNHYVLSQGQPEVVPPPVQQLQEPFGRSTNMRMTSFTDRPQQSATLPHYPTQQIGAAYPHCSTMPLPVTGAAPTLMGPGAISCHSFPRQHTTIPTHHNGVRLFNPNPYAKRIQFPVKGINTASEHHSFPQIMNLVKHKTERDSANFSLASSGDSDSCIPHT